MDCPNSMLSSPSYCNSLPVTGCVAGGIHNTHNLQMFHSLNGIHFCGFCKTHCQVFRKTNFLNNSLFYTCYLDKHLIFGDALFNKTHENAQ